MTASMHQNPRLAAAAEREMKTWGLMQEMSIHGIRDKRWEPRDPAEICHVTFSRETGAEGTEIAQLVGQQLQWEVYDRNLLDQVANRYRESRLMLDLVDETAGNWVFDILGTWMDRHVISHEKYMIQISRMIQILARRGNAVFVGRGAQFLLPRRSTFCVRIVAPLKYRIDRVMTAQGMSFADASALVKREDAGRRDFLQRYYRQNVEDLHLYDLILNVERFGITGSAEQVVHAVRSLQSAEHEGGLSNKPR